MGKFRVKIEELAIIHIQKHFKSGNKAVLKKLEKILEELTETPYTGMKHLKIIYRGIGRGELVKKTASFTELKKILLPFL